jgi:hypothetical protein
MSNRPLYTIGLLLTFVVIVVFCVSTAFRASHGLGSTQQQSSSSSIVDSEPVNSALQWPTSNAQSDSIDTLGVLSSGPYSASPNSFGGTYELSDKNSCENANVLTGFCGCPPFYAAITGGRVVNSNGPMGGSVGAYVVTCSSNNGPILLGFGGSFQLDEAGVPGSQGCRFKNSFTGACSCPQGFVNISSTVVVDTAIPGQFVESHVVFCYGSSQPQPVFGGAFQTDDDGNCITFNSALLNLSSADPLPQNAVVLRHNRRFVQIGSQSCMAN